MDQRRPSDAAKCLPSNDIVVFANYCRRFYQNSTSMVFCLEPVQVNLHIMHRRLFLNELRDLEKQSMTEEGKLMLSKVQSLLLVGLAQSNIWV